MNNKAMKKYEEIKKTALSKYVAEVCCDFDTDIILPMWYAGFSLKEIAKECNTTESNIEHTLKLCLRDIITDILHYGNKEVIDYTRMREAVSLAECELKECQQTLRHALGQIGSIKFPLE